MLKVPYRLSTLIFCVLSMFLCTSSYNEQGLETEECRDRGEVFAGAYITTIDHVIQAPMMAHYLKHYVPMFVKGKKRFACEEASYFVFHKMRKNKTSANAYRLQDSVWGEYPQQTIDVLDFAVLHLSVAERLLSRSPPLAPLTERTMNSILSSLDKFFSIETRKHHRQKMSNTFLRSTRYNNALPKITGKDANVSRNIRTVLQQTLIVIPVVLSVKADGNSATTYRKRYLKLTIESLSPFFEFISVFVMNAEDAVEVHKLGLPIWQIIHIENLAQNCALPAASMVEVTRKIISEDSWKAFKYVYFTEADQILLVRDFNAVFEWVRRNRHSTLTPHRLVVAPEPYLRTQNKSDDDIVNRDMKEDRFTYSCCMDTESFCSTRVHWKPIADPAVKLMKLYGVKFVPGNANFPMQLYRSCNVTTRQKCPKNPTSWHYTASKQ